MRAIGKVIGMAMYIISGLLMFIFWVGAMKMWLGFIGVFLALILCPGLVIFPIVFWIVEGVFPINYFLIWGIGILGVFIAGFSGVGEN
jgi:hypothetical protein